MGIFNNEMTINEENPFETDKLYRELEIKRITPIFDVIDNQMVMAVNSPWGTGKTTFLRLWNAYLKKEKYTTVFFNCWKNDFVEEPFIAFIEEIRMQMRDGMIAETFIETSKNVGKFLIKQIPTAGKKYIENKTGVDLSYMPEDELKQIISEKMDAYKKSKDSTEKFKDELTKLANGNLEKTQKPIVIFVDELDRCKPDFAITLLERIKHFFNIPNIIFILGIDKEALSNSIRVVYGENTNINGYLTRFIDMEYTIQQEYNKYYIEFLIEKYPFKEVYIKTNFYRESYEDFKHIINEILEVFDLSLRDLEKVIINLYLIMKGNKREYIEIYPLFLLIIIKRVNKGLFERIEQLDIGVKELIQELDKKYSFSKWIGKIESRGTVMEAYLIRLLGDQEYLNNKKKEVEEKGENVEWSDIDNLCINAYNSITNQNFNYRQDNLFKNIITTMNMYDNFNIGIGDN